MLRSLHRQAPRAAAARPAAVRRSPHVARRAVRPSYAAMKAQAAEGGEHSGNARANSCVCKAVQDGTATTAGSKPLGDSAAPPPAPAPAAENPAFAPVLALQQSLLSSIQAAVPVEQQGSFRTASQDGSATAAIQAWSGGPLRWLSASTLTSAALGMLSCRVMGYVGAERDAPHLYVETTVTGDKLLCDVALWPRQHLSTDVEYLDKYFGAAPAGHRSYNDIVNGTVALTAWRAYKPQLAEMKPLLSTSMLYHLPTDPANLETLHKLAAEVAELWLAFLAAQPAPAARPADQEAIDARYVAAFTARDKPGNLIACKLFGPEAVEELLLLTAGVPLPPPPSS